MRTVDQLGAAALTYATLGYRVLPLHHPVSTNANRGEGCSARAATRLVELSASIP
jgi:hypothetical protein